MRRLAALLFLFACDVERPLDVPHEADRAQTVDAATPEPDPHTNSACANVAGPCSTDGDCGPDFVCLSGPHVCCAVWYGHDMQ